MDVPRMDVAHIETPTPLNPLGCKGAGEGGTDPVANGGCVGHRRCAVGSKSEGGPVARGTGSSIELDRGRETI